MLVGDPGPCQWKSVHNPKSHHLFVVLRCQFVFGLSSSFFFRFFFSFNLPSILERTHHIGMISAISMRVLHVEVTLKKILCNKRPTKN